MGAEPESAGSRLEELSLQVRDLEQRISTLETRAGIRRETIEAAVPAAPQHIPEAEPETASVIPVLGKALLGLAAAYLLRAMSEAGALPLAAGVAVAIAYSLGWLWLAARNAEADPRGAAVRAATSVLILIPVLWEAHVRFQAMSSWTTAAALTGFPAAGLFVSWRKNLSVIAWISTLAGLISASALLIATRDLLPFTCALLALAVLVEFSACVDHWVRERWVVAMAANFAVLLVTHIATRPGGIPPSYAPMSRNAVLAVLIALLTIYLSSTVFRTLWRGCTISGFEIAQSVLAFGISIGGAIRVAQGSPTSILLAGAFSGLCAVVCYLVACAFLGRDHRHDRKLYTYATFGLALGLVAAVLLVKGTILVALWSALGVLFVRFGRIAGRMTLKWHGAMHLLAASALSGSIALAGSRYAATGAHRMSSDYTASFWIAALASTIAFVFVMRSRGPEGAGRNYQVLTLVLGANAASSVLAAAGALTPACTGGSPDFCPAVLTVFIVVVTLGSGILAVRTLRREMRWLMYGLVFTATYKLLFQDLREAQTLALVVSLLAYGGMLVLLPKALQKPRPTVRAAAAS